MYLHMGFAAEMVHYDVGKESMPLIYMNFTFLNQNSAFSDSFPKHSSQHC